MIKVLSKKSILTNIFLSILAFGLVFPPQKTNAQFVPVIDSIVGANTAAIAGSVGTELSQTLLEYAEKFLLESLKKQILDLFVSEIITWIQGGGTPNFVQDWTQLGFDATNQVVGAFVDELGAGFLCEPLKLALPQLHLSGFSATRPQYACTLDKIVGNFENFYNDFQTGGWIAYQANWEPQNNLFGLFLFTSAESQNRGSIAAQSRLNEAVSGGGFLGIRDTLGKIVTPGKTAGELVGKAVGSDLDYILSANDLSQYTSAIVDAAVSRLISETGGLASVSSTPQPRTDDSAERCIGLSGKLLESCQSYNKSTEGSFSSYKRQLSKEIDDEIKNAQKATQLINQTIVVENQILATLNSLVSCLTIDGLPTAAAQARITETNKNILFLNEEIPLAQQSATQYQALKSKLNAVKSGDWAALNEVAGEIHGVDSFLDAAQEQKNSADSRLQQAQVELAICQQ